MPWEFWPLTPYEISVLIAGAAHRDTREWERAAWMTAHFLNISGKSVRNDVTADELLGRKSEVKVIDPGAKEGELLRRLEALNLPKE